MKWLKTLFRFAGTDRRILPLALVVLLVAVAGLAYRAGVSSTNGGTSQVADTATSPLVEAPAATSTSTSAIDAALHHAPPNALSSILTLLTAPSCYVLASPLGRCAAFITIALRAEPIIAPPTLPAFMASR